MCLSGKKVFIAGVGDDRGYGWAIAKALAEEGCELFFGVWVPVYKIFVQSWNNGKFDGSRKLSDGRLMDYAKLYPIDARFDEDGDIPDEVRNSRRYCGYSNYTISDVVGSVKSDFGSVDYVVHSLANGPEVNKPLSETSRSGYLSAISSSSYSFVSMAQYFSPIMRAGGSFINLTFIASTRVWAGYGGGMSSAKAALESDTRVLAYELGKKYGLRLNSISAGPLMSRAASAIGPIEMMVEYTEKCAPLKRKLLAEDVGHAALFLLSKAYAITGVTLFVDNGAHVIGGVPQ